MVPDLTYLHHDEPSCYRLTTGLMPGSLEVEPHPCLSQQRSDQSLGEAVSQVLVCPHMQHPQLLCLHTLSNSMDLHRNIPHLGRLYWIHKNLGRRGLSPWSGKGAITVFMSSWISLIRASVSSDAVDTAMYSAAIVDFATHGCFLVAHMTGSPLKLRTNPQTLRRCAGQVAHVITRRQGTHAWWSGMGVQLA